MYEGMGFDYEFFWDGTGVIIFAGLVSGALWLEIGKVQKSRGILI